MPLDNAVLDWQVLDPDAQTSASGQMKIVLVAARRETVAGLVDAPVIGVPTSTGYGSGAGGYAALLAMLNSCAGGLAVVNIDNGFGAGYLASQINLIRSGPHSPRTLSTRLKKP